MIFQGLPRDSKSSIFSRWGFCYFSWLRRQELVSAHLDIIVRSFLTPILSGGSYPGSPVTTLRLRHGSAFHLLTKDEKSSFSSRKINEITTTLSGSRYFVIVAEAGVEPASGGYEPPEIPFLYSAIFCY